MSSSTITTVRQLKDSLSKSSDDAERALDILQRLDEADVNLKILSETLVGAAVSKMKSHESADVAAKAKALVKKWKKLAKQGGVGSGKPKLERGASSASSASGIAAKRTSSGAAASAEAASNAAAEAEWSHLPPLRKNISNKMHAIFLQSKAELTRGEGGLDPAAVSSLCVSRASEVESAVQSFSRGDTNDYKDKARSLVFNLKKNGSVRDQVLLGRINASVLVKMSPEDLSTSENSAKRAKLVSDLQDSRRLDWETANEDKINEQCGIKGELLEASLFTCGRCKSIKTTSTQKQTRSADEPMTVFVLCLNCGNRWKFS
mmetsp:Transcript_12870/g.37786  ORF Transcript_12870/g.37786 Transcript_12870/m.37786 type:complete len:319 (-) Transcript_12870:297-1253(-)